MGTTANLAEHPKFRMKPRPAPSRVYVCIGCEGQKFWLAEDRSVVCSSCGSTQSNLRLTVLVKP